MIEPLGTRISGRRNIFLVIVTFAVNAYLVFYAADALLSTADALLEAFTGAGILADARESLADGVFLASFLILLLLIFVPHLPKRVLLPPVLFLIWVDLGAYPLFSLGIDRTLELILPAAQLAFFAYAVGMLKWKTDLWLLAANKLPRKQHLLRHTLIALIFTIVCLPFVLAGLGAIAIAGLIEQQTDNYLHFGATGIDVTESVFTKGNKTVHLIGMIHIGEPAFYRTVYDSFTPGALVLTEGVTDKQGLLTHKLSYRPIAQAIGLGLQPQFQQVLADKKNQKAISAPTDAKPAPPPADPDIIDADVDLSDLSGTTVHFIDWAADLYASASLKEALAKLNAQPQAFTKDDVTIVLDDIIKKRTAKVLSEFDKGIADHDMVVIPWGAEHMPGLEAGLRDRGYMLRSKQSIRVASYETIFDRLVQR